VVVKNVRCSHSPNRKEYFTPNHRTNNLDRDRERDRDREKEKDKDKDKELERELQ